MTHPHPCPECPRVFRWGLDDDSKMVEVQGKQWVSCRESAHWKLTFHMAAMHPDAGFLCPRRAESGMAIARTGRDWWERRDGHLSCSYCGSLSPDEFFAAVEAGAEVTPTDKNYKAYIDLPSPNAGQVVQIGTDSGPAYDAEGKPNLPDLTFQEEMTGHYDRPIMGTAGATVMAKFYFQHLDAAAQQRFIDLINEKKMKLRMPGYFYRLPFFCTRADAP